MSWWEAAARHSAEENVRYHPSPLSHCSRNDVSLANLDDRSFSVAVLGLAPKESNPSDIGLQQR